MRRWRPGHGHGDRAAQLRSLDRFSEPFPPYGALAAEGAGNLLGRPRLDPLAVLVREAVQNSWDARRPGAGPVRVSIAAATRRGDHAELLRTTVFGQVPPSAAALRAALAVDDIMLLSLTDRGTTGLGGPVRADHPPAAGQPTDFVDLLFNIGQPSDRQYGGGTYGFGKTISYVVSQAGAVVVHSRVATAAGPQSRFIAAALSDHYADGGQRFTGRHWWGRSAAGSIEPVLGDEADQLAAGLSLPAFSADDTGTTIAVVAPDLRGRTPAQAMRFVADAVTWHFWPKLVARPGGGPDMSLEVHLEDDPVEVRHPDDVAPLAGYAAALRVLRSAEEIGWRAVDDDPGGVELVDIRTPRSRLHVGWLALTRMPVDRRPVDDDGADEEAERGHAASIEGLSHHIALLRQPELVIDYQEGPELLSLAQEWAGVFKPAPELDHAFALAEPPTHDGWEPMLVPDVEDRQWVNVALREIGDAVAAFASPAGTPVGGRVSAVLVADALRALVSDVPGFGADPYHEPVFPPPVPPYVIYTEVSLDRAGDRALVDVRLQVHHDPATAGTVLHATPAVAVVDGAVERRPPAGTTPVEVVGFLPDGPGPLRPGDEIELATDGPAHWWVRLRAPGGVAVTVDVTARSITRPDSDSDEDRG